MASWTVWEKASFGERRHERAVFVRDGFSWLAFLFGPLWLAANGMGLILLAYLAVMGAAGVLSGEVLGLAGTPLAGAVPFALCLWFGFEARGLRRWALARRGYELQAVVVADRLREAERRYFSDLDAPRGPQASVVAAPKRYGGGEPQVLGLFPEGTR